ncbi:DinB family protein [Paeniglutamicibacter sp. Y32M11]|uniref:DinB family protein n=1 Tax=Paeniglutamicibacter sp. Y32M11 TaxID=2853258 RepID=UPI001C529B17|nr:DinB family protein [Paeniglutamicibacter sp. Y32M11]QXQ11125.1 DinB family protein [Paeniglutamicibacter sp. Y32M11]
MTETRADPRTDPPPRGSERATLLGFLTYQRQTLALKCSGLNHSALMSRSVPPSTLSLIGLVRHLSDIERFWIRRALSGSTDAPLYWCEDSPDIDFVFPCVPEQAEAEALLVRSSMDAWESEMAYSDAVLSHVGLDDAVSAGRHGVLSVRWILTHLIEEYARHNGHADLLRECIDG